jgi:SAM-dependent methyltransferase
METNMDLSIDPGYGASTHYLGEKGAKYYADQGGGGDFKARILQHVFAPHARPTDVVLDFGCGGGFLLRALNCARRIGVEINPYARDHANSIGVECHEQVASVPDQVADVVISNHALEHVPYPIGALRELRGKLKPGGLLVLCVPVDSWRHQRHYDPNNRDHHLHTWTPRLLGNTLFESGYQVESIDIWTHRWPGRWTVACYGRLPYWLFKTICWAYSLGSGDGRQLWALARPTQDNSQQAGCPQGKSV